MLSRSIIHGSGGSNSSRRIILSRIRRRTLYTTNANVSATRIGVSACPCPCPCPRRSLSTAAFRTSDMDNNEVGEEEQNHQPYTRLFTPLDLGPDIGFLPNRVLMGSMHTGLEGHSIPSWIVPWITGGSNKNNDVVDHDTLDNMAAYFRRRAAGGVGLMVTGGVAPNWEGWVGPFASKLTNDEEMRKHKVVTEAVHSVQVPVSYGDDGENYYSQQQQEEEADATVRARICMQILHTGRYAYHPFPVSASATKSPISPFRARELSAGGIERTIADFVRAAVLAREAGYDGVEIMGSEGYLLSQFLSPACNFRTDAYGGSLENRARLPLEIIRQTRAATGKDFIIIFRLSLADLVQHGLSLEESSELALQAQAAGVTILNTGIGWHESRVPTIATSVPRAAFTYPTALLKKQLGEALSIPVAATNRINNPVTAEQVLRDTGCDLISMARPFLADPDILLKSRTNREKEINTCIACNQACLDHAFVGKTASCLVNPVACHEESMQVQPVPENERLRLAVVGAGPAGCAFAITAAQQGHHVTVYDVDSNVGGQFSMAKRVPGKEEFHETVRYFETMLEKLDVNLQLGTEITAQQMDSMINSGEVDKWIVAAGVEPRNPNIPGQEHPNVLSYIDVMKHKKPVGKSVAIIGAGGIGFDVAEYLSHYEGPNDLLSEDVSQKDFWKQWGVDPTLQHLGGLLPIEEQNQQGQESKRKIFLLQRRKGKLGAGLGRTTGWIHRATLKQEHVEMTNSCTYDKIDEHGHLHYTRNGKSHVLEVDNIILCAGQVEKQDLVPKPGDEDASLLRLRDNVYTIGGAYAAGELDAKRAIDMGTRLALRIHEDKVVPGNHVFQDKTGVEEAMFHALKKIM